MGRGETSGAGGSLSPNSGVGDGLANRFESSVDGRRSAQLGPVVDGRELAPAVLKVDFNYTGAFIGLYAYSNGAPTHSHADFQSFRCQAR
jgi:hypothetical protein